MVLVINGVKIMQYGYFFLACVCLLFLNGCQLGKTKEQVVSPAKKANIELQPLAKESSEAISAPPKIETRLLSRAEADFRKGRYLPTTHSRNAYDGFRSVLLVDPQNKQARAGLQAILLTYSERVRRAMTQGKLSAARQLLNTVASYYPQNNLLADLNKDIQKQEELMRRSEVVTNHVLPSAKPLNYEDVPLDLTSLSTRSHETTQILADIAARLSETNESVLIYARNDAEGRWIYKQMKQAVKGYRVRGDIRYSKSPKIRILPPI